VPGGGSAGCKCLVTVILDCSVTESIGITVIAASAITAAADLISVILIASQYSCLQLLRLQLFVTGTYSCLPILLSMSVFYFLVFLFSTVNCCSVL